MIWHPALLSGMVAAGDAFSAVTASRANSTASALWCWFPEFPVRARAHFPSAARRFHRHAQKMQAATLEGIFS
jgi:hypothetical protein